MNLSDNAMFQLLDKTYNALYQIDIHNQSEQYLKEASETLEMLEKRMKVITNKLKKGAKELKISSDDFNFLLIRKSEVNDMIQDQKSRIVHALANIASPVLGQKKREPDASDSITRIDDSPDSMMVDDSIEEKSFQLPRIVLPREYHISYDRLIAGLPTYSESLQNFKIRSIQMSKLPYSPEDCVCELHMKVALEIDVSPTSFHITPYAHQARDKRIEGSEFCANLSSPGEVEVVRDENAWDILGSVPKRFN